MNWKQFLRPGWRKVVLAVIMILFAPFPYMVPDPNVLCAQMEGISCNSLTGGIVFGHPILQIFLPGEFSSMFINGNFYNGSGHFVNGGMTLFENKINPVLYWFHLVYIYLLSCLIPWIYDRSRKTK
jgi:hypothetical protein